MRTDPNCGQENAEIQAASNKLMPHSLRHDGQCIVLLELSQHALAPCHAELPKHNFSAQLQSSPFKDDLLLLKVVIVLSKQIFKSTQTVLTLLTSHLNLQEEEHPRCTT